MPGYDPFARGPFPVGVRTLALVDETRGGRALPTEVWYPTTDAHVGRDLAAASQDAYLLVPGFPPVPQHAVRDAEPRAGRFPLVAFSHGFGGHRRQSTFLCTHLASHGYVVAAVDHTGNTILDVVQAMVARQTGRPLPSPGAAMRGFIAARPADVVFLLDRLLARDAAVDPDRVGMTGHSFGGWTTLATTARDRRIRAAVPLAPAGGSSPLPVALLREALDLAWDRDVPTLYLVADRDTLLPLAGMHELYAGTTSPKRMVVLENADHLHFCDRVEQVHELFRLMPQDPVFEPLRASIPPVAELCAGEAANTALRGLALAHFDAHLKRDAAAARFLGGDLRAAVAPHGARVAVVEPLAPAQAGA